MEGEMVGNSMRTTLKRSLIVKGRREDQGPVEKRYFQFSFVPWELGSPSLCACWLISRCVTVCGLLPQSEDSPACSLA